MLLSVRVIPKASRCLIKEEEARLKVYLTRPAQDGLANEQLISLLAEHFNIAKSRIRIIRGHKSKDKFVEVNA